MKKILISDRSRMFYALIERWAHEEYPDLEVSFASDGFDTLLRCTHTPPDLLFVDISIDQLSGMQVLRTLKEQRNGLENVPVVVITDNPNRFDREYVLMCGGEDYLAKTGKIDDIKRVIETYLFDE